MNSFLNKPFKIASAGLLLYGRYHESVCIHCMFQHVLTLDSRNNLLHMKSFKGLSNSVQYNIIQIKSHIAVVCSEFVAFSLDQIGTFNHLLNILKSTSFSEEETIVYSAIV